MSTLDIVVGLVLMAAGVVCIFLANQQYWELQFEINERLPQNEKFDPVFWTPITWMKFHELRKQVFPDSPRPKRALRLAIVGFCCFFSGVVFLLVKANS